MARPPTPPEKVRRGEQLAAELARERGRARLSQPQLAEQAGVGLDAIRKIERRAVHEPGFFTVVDLAMALGLEVNALAQRTRG
jgi:transcriptional regulator with XRE-family HTH domain